VLLSSLVINGLLTGLIYGLIAVGLTVIFGVMRIINMSHGDMVMLGMYAAWVLYDRFGLNPYLSMVLTVPLFFALGALIYEILDPIPPKQREMSSLIITLGISFTLATSAMLVFTADYRTVTLPYSDAVVDILGMRLGYPALISSGISLVLVGLFSIFLSRTHLGRAIRATAIDPTTASLMGVNVKRVSRATFGMGVALAGLAGGALAPIYYVYPFVGGNFIIKAFAVVVLGGMTSVGGALAGGLLLGVAEALGGAFLEHSLKDIIVFVLFLGVLLFRPAGLFGRRERTS